jgi:hypothetical protein
MIANNSSIETKDIDVVVARKAIDLCLKLWPLNVYSEVMGHLVVRSEPWSVKLFEMDCFSTGDPIKDANRVSYRKATRNCVYHHLLGVCVRVYVGRGKA